jgi:hypothetical protein
MASEKLSAVGYSAALPPHEAPIYKDGHGSLVYTAEKNPSSPYPYRIRRNSVHDTSITSS